MNIHALQKIKINSALLSKQLFAGNFLSVFKGQGINFAELREYQTGDDYKRIDWATSARMNKPFVRINEAERQQNIVFLVDCSKSIEAGNIIKTKKQLIIELCFLLAYSSAKNNDKIGSIFFSDEVEKIIPLSNNSNQLSIIAKFLLDFEPENKGTNLHNILNFINFSLKKNAIVFILSDFISNINYQKELAIAAKKFQLIVIQIIDNFNNSVPNIGLVKIFDEETNKNYFIDTSQKRMNLKIKENNDKLFLVFKKNNIKYLQLELDDNYIVKLKNFFERYKK